MTPLCSVLGITRVGSVHGEELAGSGIGYVHVAVDGVVVDVVGVAQAGRTDEGRRRCSR